MGRTKKEKTYATTVMLRITGPFASRLERVKEALAQDERDHGRARKIGRATVVHQAMLIGLPQLEASLGIPSPDAPAAEPEQSKPSTLGEDF